MYPADCILAPWSRPLFLAAVRWLWPSKKNICQNLSIYVTLRIKIFFWKIVFSQRTVLLFSVRLRKISVSISILWINELPHPEDHFHWYHPHPQTYWWLFGFDNNISRKKYSRRDRPPPPIYCKYPTFFVLFVFSDISLTLTLTFSRKVKQANYNANCRQSTRCQYPEWMCP